MDASKISGILLAWCFILSSQVFCLAQKQVTPSAGKSNFYLNGNITLDSLTRYVHRRSGMRFSFNSSKVKGSTVINFPKGEYSFSMLLSSLRKTTSLSFTIYKGYIVFSDHPAFQKHPSSPNHPSSQNQPSSPTKKADMADKVVRPVPNPKTADSTALFTIRTNRDSINKPSSNDHPIVSGKAVPGKSSGDAGRRLSFKNLHLNFGLQWQVNLPVYGTKNYFTGTNGNKQVYNILIPGLWVSRSWNDKHQLLLQVVPVLEYFAGNKVLTDSSGPGGPVDSSSIQKNRVLIKTSGAGAELQYNYYIDDKWSVGVGLEYHLQFSALVGYKTIKRSTGVVLADSVAGVNKSSADWQFMKPSFMAGSVGLAFRLIKFQVGAVMVLPVTRLASSPGAKIRPLNGLLFFRWWIR